MKTRREMGQRQSKRKAALTEESSEEEEQEEPRRLKSVVVVPQSIEEELGGEPEINLQAEDEVSTEEPQLASEEAKIVIAQLQARISKLSRENEELKDKLQGSTLCSKCKCKEANF